MEAAEYQKLNQWYRRLEMKQAALVYALHHRVFTLQSGFYNGNYYRNPDGEYEMAYYPIPVISVKGYCDIEVNFDFICISTKRKRKDALEYSHEKIKGYRFEVCGVEDYLCDYYKEGQTIAELKENIRQSDEKEISYNFFFDFDVEEEKIYEFAKLLRREGFYY